MPFHEDHSSWADRSSEVLISEMGACSDSERALHLSEAVITSALPCSYLYSLFSFLLGCKPCEAGTLPTNRAYVSIMEGRNEKSPGQKELELASGGDRQEADSRAADSAQLQEAGSVGMGVLKQPLQGSGKSCPFVQGAPGSTTSCVLFTPPLTPTGFSLLLRTWLSPSVPRLGWWVQETAQAPWILAPPYILEVPEAYKDHGVCVSLEGWCKGRVTERHTQEPESNSTRPLLASPRLPSASSCYTPPTCPFLYPPGSRPTILAKQNVLGSVFC